MTVPKNVARILAIMSVLLSAACDDAADVAAPRAALRAEVLPPGETTSAAAVALVNRDGGMCAEIGWAGRSSGTAVTGEPCVGSVNQQWTLQPSGDITAYGGAVCLDVDAGKPADGTKVQVWACHGGANQRWTHTAAGELRSAANGKCLDLDSGRQGGRLQTWTCLGHAHQKWTTGSGRAAPAASTARSFFVAPSGTAAGDGTAARPWALATAFAHPAAVQPGDTVWLTGGTYRGDFVSRLTGTAARPVVVRQVPGARATIDGSLSITGRHTWYWGFEVTYSDPTRVSGQRGSDPTDIPREAKTVYVAGPHNKLIHLVVHDMGDGIGAFSAAEGTEITGNLIYNNGWTAPDRGHGHGLYLQNRGATQAVVDNVIFNSFSTGIKIAGSSVAPLRNFLVEGNAVFQSGMPATMHGAQYNFHLDGGAPGQVGGIRVVRNSLYHTVGTAYGTTLAPGSAPGTDAVFAHNVSQGRVDFGSWMRLEVDGNKFTTGSTVLAGGDILLGVRVMADSLLRRGVWSRNQYASPASVRRPFYGVRPSGAANYDMTGWRQFISESAASTYTTGTPAAAYGTANVIVRPSHYEAGRASVTVWNWGGADLVQVDLAGVLRPGDHYQIHHVYDVYGAPVAEGQYTGQRVSLPVRAHLPPRALGHDVQVPSTGREFNVYLVRRR